MICKNCGSELEPGALFCGECGTRVELNEAAPAVAAAESALDALFASFDEAPAEAEKTLVEEAPDVADAITPVVESADEISAEAAALVEEISAAFAEEKAEVEEAAEELIEEQAPVEEYSDTAIETKAAVEEVAEVVEETAEEAVEEAVAPVEEAVAPVEEAVAPVEEAAEEIAEEAAPIEEAAEEIVEEAAPAEEAAEEIAEETAAEAESVSAAGVIPALEENLPLLCPECGAIVAPGSIFCSTCGSRLEKLTPAEDSCMEIVTEVTPVTPSAEAEPEAAPEEEAEKKRSFREMAGLAFGEDSGEGSEKKEKKPGLLSVLLAKRKEKKAAKQAEKAAEAPAEADEVPAVKPGIKLSKKVCIAAVAAVLVVVALVGVLAFGGSGKGVSPSAKPVSIAAGDGELLQIYQGTVSSFSECDTYKTVRSALDGSAAVVLTDEGELFLCSGGKAELLATEVVAFETALDCSKTAYLQEGDDGYDLYLISGSKAKKIASDVLNQLAISPNGKTVAYAKQDSSNEVRGYIYNGKEQELGKGKVAFAVSDDAKYIYYTKENISYCQKGIKADEKTKLGSRVTTFYFNKDYTELLYQSESSTYVCLKGGERVKLCALAYPFYGVDGPCMVGRGSGCCVYGVSSFVGANLAAYQDGSFKLYRIDKGYETHSICKAAKYVAADDNSVIYYRKNHTLYRINPAKENAEGKALVQDVEELLTASADGKSIFYLDEDNALWCANAKGKSKQITADEIESFALLGGKDFYYVADGELYLWNGSKTVKVSGIDEVEKVVAYSRSLLFVYTEDNVLCTTDGSSFSPLYEQ